MQTEGEVLAEEMVAIRGRGDLRRSEILHHLFYERD